jgi:hypothetical protein
MVVIKWERIDSFFMLVQQLYSLGVQGFLSLIQDPNTCISYSQFGEDTLILEWLSSKDFKLSSKYYVDIGAYHPTRFSNTKLLNLLGWKGINVDPNPHTIELFNQQRPHDINLNIGIASSHRIADLFCFQEGAINTFDIENAKALVNQGWKFNGKHEIELFSLNEVLEKYLPQEIKNAGIGFLDIDCEGLDSEIILNFDIETYRPAIISIEAHGFDPLEPRSNKIVNFITQFDYKIFAIVGATLLLSSKAKLA